MILEDHLACNGDDVRRVHSHRGEGKDGVNSDDRSENEETHESCQRDGKISSCLIPNYEEKRLTGDEDDEPDCVDRDLVLRHPREESTVGKSVVTREGVERTSVRLSSGSDDLERDETDEGPEDVETGGTDILPDDLGGRVSRNTVITRLGHVSGTEDVDNVVHPVRGERESEYALYAIVRMACEAHHPTIPVPMTATKIAVGAAI